MESHIKYSKGVCWIGDCRIPFVDEPDPSAKRYQSYRNVDNLYGGYGDTHNEYKEQQGRFTPNLLVCDDMLNDGRVGGSAYCPPTEYKYEANNTKFNSGARRTKTGIGDKGTNSRYYDLDLWFDKMLEGL